jgi:hypothetical protein
MAVNNFLHHYVPKEILCLIFSEYLSPQEVSLFDIAICNQKKRPAYLECIRSVSCIWVGDKKEQFSPDGISWMSNRNIKIRHLNCKSLCDDIAANLGCFGIYLKWLNVDEQGISDIGLIQIAESCPNMEYLDISDCEFITDISVVKIAESCEIIKSFNLAGCYNITDACIIKIAEKCSNLRHFDISGCYYRYWCH